MTDENRSGDERLDAAVDEAGALRTAVEGLTAAILSAVPKEDKRFKTLVLLAVVGGPLLFALTAIFAIKTTVDGNARTAQIRQGVACLLADLDDHRHVNQDAHEALARNHGFGKIIQPDVIPLTQAQAARLKATCTPYVRSVAGSADGAGGAQEHR